MLNINHDGEKQYELQKNIWKLQHRKTKKQRDDVQDRRRFQSNPIRANQRTDEGIINWILFSDRKVWSRKEYEKHYELC